MIPASARHTSCEDHGRQTPDVERTSETRKCFCYRVVAADQRGTRTKKKLDVAPFRPSTSALCFGSCRFGDGDRGPLGTRQLAAAIAGTTSRRLRSASTWGGGDLDQRLKIDSPADACGVWRTSKIGYERRSQFCTEVAPGPESRCRRARFA